MSRIQITFLARYIGSQTEDGGEEQIMADNADEALDIARSKALDGDWMPGERIRIVLRDANGDDVAETEVRA